VFVKPPGYRHPRRAGGCARGAECAQERGLQVEDRIKLALSGDPGVLEAVQTRGGCVRRETLAVGLESREGATVAKPAGGYCQHTEIEGLALMIRLQRAECT